MFRLSWSAAHWQQFYNIEIYSILNPECDDWVLFNVPGTYIQMWVTGLASKDQFLKDGDWRNKKNRIYHQKTVWKIFQRLVVQHEKLGRNPWQTKHLDVMNHKTLSKVNTLWKTLLERGFVTHNDKTYHQRAFRVPAISSGDIAWCYPLTNAPTKCCVWLNACVKYVLLDEIVGTLNTP